MSKKLFFALCFFFNFSFSSISNNFEVTVCGGGNEAIALAGMIGSHGFKVNILTRRPKEWHRKIVVNLLKKSFEVDLNLVTQDPSQVIPHSQVILVTVPAYAWNDVLSKIAPFVRENSIIGALPGTGGFDYFCKKYLNSKITFFSSQRVPYISRIKKYGHEVDITGYVHGGMKYAVSDRKKEKFVLNILDELLLMKGRPLPSMLGVNLVNSNSLLHTTRLYSLGTSRSFWETQQFFYGNWDDLSSKLLLESDRELHLLYKAFPQLDFSYMATTCEHYEIDNVEDLTKKIRSIESVKYLTDPIIKVGDIYQLDYGSRYFTEDFIYKLGFIYLICKIKNIKAPIIEKITQWGFEKLGQNVNELPNLFNIHSEKDLII